MTMFKLIEFEPDRNITLRAHRFHWVFGEVAVTYLVTPSSEGCRLVVKLIGRYAPEAVGRVMRPVLPWVDLVMMRRQLTKLRDLAQRDTRTRRAAELESRIVDEIQAPIR
jgi:hypothetical protein